MSDQSRQNDDWAVTNMVRHQAAMEGVAQAQIAEKFEGSYMLLQIAQVDALLAVADAIHDLRADLRTILPLQRQNSSEDDQCDRRAGHEGAIRQSAEPERGVRSSLWVVCLRGTATCLSHDTEEPRVFASQRVAEKARDEQHDPAAWEVAEYRMSARTI